MIKQKKLTHELLLGKILNILLRNFIGRMYIWSLNTFLDYEIVYSNWCPGKLCHVLDLEIS